MTPVQKPRVLIKIGGEAATRESALAELVQEMTALRESADFLLLHGGGKAVSAMQKQYGLEPRFVDGIRQTTAEEMALVDAALAGQMNKQLVRRFTAAGVPAVGLSGCDGPLTVAESIDPAAGSRTGRITAANPALLTLLLDNGYLPVISPVSSDAEGDGLNINADEAALALAAALPVDSLVFLSDIPGVLKEKQVITSLTPIAVEEEIEAGVISDGMIPKVRSSAAALEQGVGSVIIGEFTCQGDLESLLEGKRGSRIIRE